MVPNSEIRSTAQYDAATLLLKSEQWSRAASVLEDFRKRFPKHKELSSITHKLALVYEKSEQNLLAAQEYERISLDDTNDRETQRTSSLVAADLYAKEKNLHLPETSPARSIEDRPFPHRSRHSMCQYLEHMSYCSCYTLTIYTAYAVHSNASIL